MTEHIRVLIADDHNVVRGGLRAFLETEPGIEVIGEASNAIIKRYPEVARRYPRIPLGIAYEMRNAVAHGNFKVDLIQSGELFSMICRCYCVM